MRLVRQRLAGVLAVAFLALAPRPAAAVTVDQIVALARAGVSDTVILALIDRDKTIFALEPDQLVALQKQGVSEPVILAMLKSGREDGERAAQAAADLNAGFIMASLSPAPEVVVVGHGPDVPNGEYPGVFPPPVPGGVIAVPFAYPGRRHARGAFAQQKAIDAGGREFGSAIGVPSMSPFRDPPVAHPLPAAPGSHAAPILCRADVRGAHSDQPLSFITACPPAMQPAHAAPR